MNKTNDRFILLPSNFSLSSDRLHYKDLLTYIAIRSFNNSITDKCLPSLETIALRSGMSKKYVFQSITRLERSGLIKVERATKKHVANRYTFKETKYFNQIPYEIFEQSSLSTNQIAMLVALRRFFNSVTLQLEISKIADIAKILGLTYKTVYVQYKSLITAGYIIETERVLSSGIKKTVTKLSDKLNWIYERTPLNPTHNYKKQPETIQIK